MQWESLITAITELIKMISKWYGKKSKHFLVGGNNTHKKLQKKNLFSVLTGSTKQQNKWLLTLIYPLALHTLLYTLPPSLAVLAMVNF